ncbi:cytochrome-c oxidase, cbb3-type subunit III [Dyella marensis]|uniref:Cbb3-type cytochrome c oxidase subunit n=1 Tax=Dyella marensis TaxID=500610 RepID=A0A1I1X7Q5_9GAMM|nr:MULTISPECIES: cytochrome-c oxidase, cbb3-type subunit III [Dyella]SFE01733.1 cytochrome c oxidase cbb3-type subunit 3 [Dyella marensis]
MSLFWSIYVGVLIAGNLGLATFLYFYGTRVKIPIEGDGTTGHSWDNGKLRESVRKLPRWWALMSLASLVAAIGYLVLFPGFGNFKGVLGWTSAQEVRQAREENANKLDALFARYRLYSVDRLSEDDVALQYGHRLFQDNCAACHGAMAEGGYGFPALTVNGDDGDFVMATALNGRNGVMPPWGAVLGEQGVSEVANYVLSLSGSPHDAARAQAGAARFKETCVACHGADGKGSKAVGAPDLTDRSWIYGGDLASVTQSIRHGRNGIMPAWKNRLGEDQVRMIAAWLRHHTLRERPPQAAPVAAAP